MAILIHHTGFFGALVNHELTGKPVFQIRNEHKIVLANYWFDLGYLDTGGVQYDQQATLKITMMCRIAKEYLKPEIARK